MNKTIWVMILLLFPLIAHAEIYKGIGPLDTLGDLKRKFPKASFTRLNPGWAKETDVMYQITGDGMSGTIVVKFYDGRSLYKEYTAKNPNDPNIEIMNNIANETDDNAISVDWVRWVPDAPITLSRFIAKYGKPEKSGFADEDLQPYRHWENKGLIGFLTDDEKYVLRIDFEFTLNEKRAAWKNKFDMIPPWLSKSDTPTSKKASSKKIHK